jgi:2-amino-4-hydroxy-6-hydroxymethyldihydropteridine diphosphokinase
MNSPHAVLSIGSNLGDRLGYLQSAVTGLGDYLAGPRSVSAVYETAPWGGIEQPAYLNAVVIVTGDRSPGQWLELAHVLEQAAGRTRETHWGARTLDVDIIAINEIRSADATLTLPHPHAHERAFVLVPWLDVDPEASLPGHGRVADLVSTMDICDVRRWGTLGYPR